MDAFHEFWNIFAASVHNNNSVPVPVKFMYLKTHLRGDAANIIANFQPTEENYEDAVRTIISTYDRPEHLRMRLWDKLNKQAPAKDSAASQRATLGSIRAIWSQMKRLKEESSIGALNMIRSKFPRRTREKVGEMKNKEDQMWTVDDLLKAFDTVIDRLQIVEDADPTPYAIYNSDSTVRQTSSPPRRYFRERPQQTRPLQCQPSTCPTCSRPLCSPSEYRTARSRSPTPYYPRRSSRSPARPQRRAYQDYCCAFCQVEGHRAEDCFEVPYTTQRRTIVKQEAPPCALCGRSHHLALCFNRPRASNTFTPTTSFHRRSISPKRVQFDIEAQTSTDRALQRSRSSSPRASVLQQAYHDFDFRRNQFTEDSLEVTLTLWDKYDRPIVLQLWTRDVNTTVPCFNYIDDVTQDYSDERVEVDVLIGIDNYWRVVDLNRNERLPSGLILSHTRFGPVLSGSVHPAVNNTTSAMTVLNDDAPGTEQLVRSLLGLDTVGLEEDETSTDASTIRHFYDTVRVIDGNIYVSFPWRFEHPPLADNKALAFRRLQSYSWDDVLNEQDMQKWDTTVKVVKDFHSQVPRFIGLTHDSAYDLVVCSDASRRAYAVAVYILTRPNGKRPMSNLLFAKAKLAPPGAITIPRMELLACHMAAKTVKFLRTQLKIHLQSIRFLTDSQIVLYWIQTSKPLKTFVANRVKYIRHVLSELKSDKIDSGFYYINTDHNSADCATRGLTASELQNHMWWIGPSFFTGPFCEWPCQSFDSEIPPAGGEAKETTARIAFPSRTSSTSSEHSYRANARVNIQDSQCEH
ncbi:unnamed protein product [Cylicocyclus nassatus]|uniref:Uncharacterized protein n=1 Tax=Cylicocyclus nassatus TaxID=53992 RepID=A0AA36H685_CYLNA|nr:unnamed protein product [Cylicocyclus nassatus]